MITVVTKYLGLMEVNNSGLMSRSSDPYCSGSVGFRGGNVHVRHHLLVHEEPVRHTRCPRCLEDDFDAQQMSNNNCSMTTWVIELVIAGVCINGNSIHVLSAKDELEKELQVFEPLTTSVLP